MRLTSLLLIGVAVAGVTGLALAAGSAVHEMTVAMPNGGTAHIRYTGDVPPKINFVSGPASPLAHGPFAMTAFGPGFGPASPFAEIERVQALMDRQMAAMMIQARHMQAAATADPLYRASLNGQPVGTYCLRSVQITASGGGTPKVVSHTEGNCGDSPTPQSKSPASTTSQGSLGPLQSISYHPRIPPRPRQGI